jgi:hypothetical protein
MTTPRAVKLSEREEDQAFLEIEFQETVWEGCSHLDCVPSCIHEGVNYRCARFELAFREWYAGRAALRAREGKS